MSVLKNLRTTSEMEFYKNAIRIRKSLTELLLKDFGYKKNPRSIRQYIKDISDEDAQVINAIYTKYNINPNKAYQISYKSWRGNLSKFNCYHAIKNMDELYIKLFGGNEWILKENKLKENKLKQD